MESNEPAVTPIANNRRCSESMSLKILLGVAPIAMRMPTSEVRRATEYADSP